MSFVFFDALFPKADINGKDLGFAAIALHPGGEVAEGSGPTQTHFFAWPSQREDLVAFCLHNSDKDVYTAPALFKIRGSIKGSNIGHQWVAYANAETMPLGKLKTAPTMAVETSEGRHDLFWVTETDDPAQLVDVSHAIVTTHAADGCNEGSWDAGQLFRVPGTGNSSHGGHWRIPQPAMGATYTLKALASAYPPYSTQDRLSTASEMPPKSEWYYSAQSIRESAEVFRSSPNAYSLYASDLTLDQTPSKALWSLLGILSRLSVSRLTGMHIAWDAKCNALKSEGRSEEELWKQLCKAYDHPDNQPVRNSFSDVGYRKDVDSSEENPEKKLAAFAESISILAPEERDLVSRNTFVDRYEHWAGTRTDAPSTYHRAGAATILSAVFGEFGKCPTTFEINLTLWFFILGPTTRARKTTAMMMWVDILDDLSGDMFPYLLGSDATSEALSAILPERNGRTSVFYRDEAHGLLYEQSKKRYLAGLREYMTELFTGRVRVSLRVGNMKDSDERDSGIIKTNFLMFLCGTLHQVAESLTVKDYQSGHLARFLIAEADPPPITEEGMYTEQFDGQNLSDDSIRQGLLNDLSAARTFWMSITEPGETVLIPFEAEAWRRLQKAKYLLIQSVEGHEMAEVLLPTAERMGDSMMKMAILLAMADRQRQVRMPHLFRAMELAEEWYKSTVKIAGKILHSEWASRQDEILAAIQARREGVTEQDIYSRFRSKVQKSDIESDLIVLAKSGLIHRRVESGRVRYIPVARS